jgi:hypothetical protein
LAMVGSMGHPFSQEPWVERPTNVAGLCGSDDRIVRSNRL